MRRALVLLALPLALLACGDDDDDDSADTAATDATTATSDEAADGTTEETTAGTTAGTVSEEAAAWCAVTEELSALGQQPVTSDPGSLEQTYADAAEIIERASAAAPESIADDVAAAARGFELTRDALEAADWDVEAVDEDALNDEIGDLTDANQRINEYTLANCGAAG